jgi:hypothetical protein
MKIYGPVVLCNTQRGGELIELVGCLNMLGEQEGIATQAVSEVLWQQTLAESKLFAPASWGKPDVRMLIL